MLNNYTINYVHFFLSYFNFIIGILKPAIGHDDLMHHELPRELKMFMRVFAIFYHNYNHNFFNLLEAGTETEALLFRDFLLRC